jgi:hypothetical protein
MSHVLPHPPEEGGSFAVDNAGRRRSSSRRRLGCLSRRALEHTRLNGETPNGYNIVPPDDRGRRDD